MRISFAGFDSPIDLNCSRIAVLQIENKALFARVVQSLLQSKGMDALEPYTVWDESGNAVPPGKAFLPVCDPFSLPWSHKSLAGGLYAKLESMLRIDEEVSAKLQLLGSQLRSEICCMGFDLNGDYGFAVEWEMRRFLKAFDFGIGPQEGASLLDNLIRFFDYVADMAIAETLLFVNLKTFLTKNELSSVYERLFFHGIRALLLENHESEYYNELERKTVVDQHFIEYEIIGWSEGPSSAQGGICSNGFGAVAF